MIVTNKQLHLNMYTKNDLETIFSQVDNLTKVAIVEQKSLTAEAIQFCCEYPNEHVQLSILYGNILDIQHVEHLAKNSTFEHIRYLAVRMLKKHTKYENYPYEWLDSFFDVKKQY